MYLKTQKMLGLGWGKFGKRDRLAQQKKRRLSALEHSFTCR
jgi:hypothetical protein